MDFRSPLTPSMNMRPISRTAKRVMQIWLPTMILAGVGLGSVATAKSDARSLYTYSFGGLENMAPTEVVTLLTHLGYGGLAVEARGEESLKRLNAFHELSAETDLEIVAGFMAHRFDKYGFSDGDHRAAIDRLAPHGGTLWVWVRDVEQDGSITDEKVESFIRGILEYAESKGVKIVLYPHYNTYYPTTLEALPLVEKIDSPSLSIGINLCHELMSDQGHRLAETFAAAQHRLGAVILSGSLIELDRTSVRSMNDSTILSLDESEYNLRPFMRLIKESGFEGPVGFINFNPETEPKDYLSRSMKEWRRLCAEVGLGD